MQDGTGKRVTDAQESSGGCPHPGPPPFGWREAREPPPRERGRVREEAAREECEQPVADRPFYEALLYPNRSLSQRGFLILVAGTALFGAAFGALFLVIGAWPIFGYIGVEWLLFWWLLSAHFRGERGAERIRLYADRLVLQQIDAKGRIAERVFEPYWLRVVLQERGFENPALLLRSHGSSVEIGAFLGPAERRSFAAEFDQVLARWRAA